MEIFITNEAVEWFKKEYDIQNKATVRFFVRYGGFGGNIPAFSLGVNLELPNTVYTSTTINEVTFYVEESDAWYFEDKNLYVSFNEKLSEPKFEYKS